MTMDEFDWNRTVFVLLAPDALARHLATDIVDRVERIGYRPVAWRVLWHRPVDLDAFHAQVRRVLRPGGIVAEWTYADCSITPAVDAVKQRLYVDLLDSYWPPERRLVESGYAELDFPFTRLAAPAFGLGADWDLAQFLAYLRSWSATQRYLAALGRDPVSELEAEFVAAWEDPAVVRRVRWDLAMRIGRLD